MRTDPATCYLLASASMIGAYVPDIDHRKSTVTRSVPVLGHVASFVARAASRRVYAVTKGPADEPWSGEHRHLTHTVLFAVVFGALIGFGAAGVAARFGHPDAGYLGFLVGLAVAVGCVTHCLGDALTEMGCPFLFPLPIAGETWYELGPPKILRFKTGGTVENMIVFPALCVAVVVLTPDVWPLAQSMMVCVFRS